MAKGESIQICQESHNPSSGWVGWAAQGQSLTPREISNRCRLGLRSHEGLTGAGGSASQGPTHMAGGRPPFLSTWVVLVSSALNKVLILI